jgi:hypothetical protein
MTPQWKLAPVQPRSSEDGTSMTAQQHREIEGWTSTSGSELAPCIVMVWKQPARQRRSLSSNRGRHPGNSSAVSQIGGSDVDKMIETSTVRWNGAGTASMRVTMAMYDPKPQIAGSPTWARLSVNKTSDKYTWSILKE